MKKKIGVVTFVVLFAVLIHIIVLAYNMGDVNEDGFITAADARLTLRYSAHIEKLNENQINAADVDSSGMVTAADARKILRVSGGLESFSVALSEEAATAQPTNPETTTEETTIAQTTNPETTTTETTMAQTTNPEPTTAETTAQTTDPLTTTEKSSVFVTESTTVADISSSDIVYITPTGSKYHKSTCRTIKNSCSEISRSDAIANGYEACKVCKP